VDANKIKESTGPLPRHQEMIQRPGWLRRNRIGIHEVMHFVLAHTVAVSYVWESSEHADPNGTQADALRAWLRVNPKIQFVWIDWCCLPQKPRTTKEEADFKHGLAHVNMVYLACNVVKILNSQYLGRFWPQYEAWLSYRRYCTDSGNFTTEMDRSFDAFTGFAAEDSDEAELMHKAIAKRWSKATIEEVIEKLGKSEVAVTNGGDKENQLGKITELLHTIREQASHASG